jgi:hypothetical protein
MGVGGGRGGCKRGGVGGLTFNGILRGMNVLVKGRKGWGGGCGVQIYLFAQKLGFLYLCTLLM